MTRKKGFGFVFGFPSLPLSFIPHRLDKEKVTVGRMANLMTFRLADYRKTLMSFHSRADETEKVICGERARREPDDERHPRH